MRYIPNTSDDRRAMLQAIGASSIEALFEDIPPQVRERFRPLGLAARSEMDVSATLHALSARNETGGISFLGGGIYDHYIPSLVSHLLSRSEFFTAYTPYQAEISQGTLTAMFEFQSLVCELTGMEVAN
ncbi:MAG TPA: glycine dehydrogenase, partial [Candidatus Acetothermia bacterium]|nr:glycine dehydrogenase [Candidatus Acetothermia bacterium]